MNRYRNIGTEWTQGVLCIVLTVLFVELAIAAGDVTRSNSILIRILEEDERSAPDKAVSQERVSEDQNVPLAYRRSVSPLKAVGDRKPEIQIYLLKGHVNPDSNWGFSTEYRYSGRSYEESSHGNKLDDKYDREKQPVNGDGNGANQSGLGERPPQLPSIGSRNIVDVRLPSCPEGHLRDSKGMCRPRASRMFARGMAW